MSRRVAKTKFKASLKLVASWICVASFAEVSLASSFPMTYSGRLTQQTGAPLDGPVDITVKFWTSANSGNTVGTPIDFTDVTLNQGVFTLPFELTPAQISAIFGDGTDPVFIEVTAAGKTYPRQQYTYVPLALRVPVDTKTLAFDADGKLGLSLTNLPSANQFLTKDSNGRLSWGSPAVTTLQGQTIAAATPSSGQVLTFNGGQWIPTTLTSSGSGSVNSSGMQPAGNYLTALTGDVVATGPGSSTAILASVALPGTATKITFDAKGRVTAGTSLTSADITTALGYTPLNKDGSTPLTGNWAVGGKDITGVGNLALSSNTTFALGAYTTDPTSLTAIDAGKMWYNGGSLKFWNGSAVQTLGVSGAGLTTLNGMTGNTQTFGIGTSGNAPSFSSAANVHTLNIPLASAGASVTAGLISNADYAAFNSKVSSVTAGSGISVTNSSGSVTVSFAATGSAGTFTKVSTNAQGQVTSGTTLASSDIPDLDANKITSGLLGVSRGGTGLASGNSGGIPYFSDANTLASSSPFALNGIVLGGGSNGAPTSTAALSNGQLLIGSTGTAPVPASLSSGANASVTVTPGAGSITLDTAQDIRPTASPTFATVNAATLASATYVAGTADNSATPGSGMLRAANAVGSDVVGANLVLASGNGAGTGGSGSIRFNTAAADVTGATANTLATRMTITSSGNVGIGTTAPDSILALNAATGDVRTSINKSNGSYGYVRFEQGGLSRWDIGVSNDNETGSNVGSNFFINMKSDAGDAGGTNRAVTILRSSGNVGIGTTAPSYALDVLGNAATANQVLRLASAINNNTMLNVNTSGGNTYLNLFASDGTTIKAHLDTNNATYFNGGNVGIGTSAPSATFQVNSSSGTGALITRSDFTSGNYGNIVTQRSMGTMAAPLALDTPRTFGGITFSGYDGSVFSTFLSGPGIYGVTTQGWTTTAHGSGIFLTTTPNDSTTAAERMRIDHSGNVGIGTTSPTQKLDVAGVIRSSSGGIMFPDGSIMTSALPTPSAGYNSTTDLNLAADSGGNGTGNISVSTKGIERVRVTNSGNIGIGTTSPNQQLHVYNATSSSIAISSMGGAQGLYMGADGNQPWFGSSTNSDLRLVTNLSEKARLTATGNLGIGTTTPQSKLDINGAAAIGSYAGTTAAPTNSLIVSGNIGVGTSIPSQPLEVAGVIKSSSGGFMFPDGSVMTTAASTGSNGSSSTTDLNLNSDSGAAGSGDIMLSTRGAERMRIANSGNVGIGTSNPADKLFVWATKESTTTPQTPGLAVGDASLANTGVGGGIAFWGNYTGTTPIAGATIHAMKNNATAGDTGFNLAFNTRPNAGKPTERMRITSTGNVGIGTTAPAAQMQIGADNTDGRLYIDGAGSSSNPLSTGRPTNDNAHLIIGRPSSTSADAGGIEFITSPSGAGYGWKLAAPDMGSGTTSFHIHSRAASGTWTERLTISNGTGNVGIGTTTPSTKLAVAGSASFTGNVGVGTTLPTQALEVAGTIKSSTGGIMFPDGTVMTSAASPSTGSSSITDLNLGADIGAIGSGVLSFSTAGIERMRVANNGNVGIGTTAPVGTLQVEQASYVSNAIILNNGLTGAPPAYPGSFTPSLLVRTNQTTGSRPLFFGIDNGAGTGWAAWLTAGACGSFNQMCLDIGNGSTVTTALQNSGTTLNIGGGADGNFTNVVFANTGNVGIGTTSPQRLLDLSSTASSGLTEQLVLRNASTSTTAGAGAGLYFALTNGSASRHAAIDALISNAATGAADLTFSTTDGTSFTEKMRIQAGGSVAIGTTTPFNKLTVAGNADFTGKVGIGSNIPTQALDVAGVIRSSTGGIMFPDGSVMTSATTPGTGTSSTGDLTFVADSGSTGNGVITFATKGSEKMRITNGGSIGFGTAGPLSKVDVSGGMAVGSYAGANAAPTNGLIVSGNVGIGTTAPTSILDVRGNVLTNSTYGFSSISSVTPTATIYINAPATNTLAFANASTERMRIDANGNVGIGTTAVGSKLQVNGNAAIGYSTSTAGPTNGLTVSGKVGIGTTAPGQMLEVAGTIRSTSGGIMFPDGTVMTTASGGTSSGTTSVTDLAFASGTGTSSSGVITLATHNLERMRVDYNGNVGIGAAAPVNKLDVAGGVAIGAIYAGGNTAPSNGLIVQGNVGIGTTTPALSLEIQGAIASATYNGLRLTNSSYTATGRPTLDFYNNNASANFSSSRIYSEIGLVGTASKLYFDVANSSKTLTNRMVIDVNGNVGIGTTAPLKILDVESSDTNNTSIRLGNTTTGGNAFLLQSTGSASVLSAGKFNLYDVTAAASRLTVDTAGNVGIGSTAPAQKLDVAGTIRSSSGGFVFPDGTVMTTAITATTVGASSTDDLNLAADTDGTGGGAIVVSTNNVERMRVLNSGSIGIGTAAPQSALDVAGGVSLGNYAGVTAAPLNGLIVSGNVGIGTNAPSANFEVQGTTPNATSSTVARFRNNFITTSTAPSYVLALNRQNSATAAMYLGNDGSNNAIIAANNGHLRIGKDVSGAYTEYVRVDTAGNVGIGTTAPTANLSVVGSNSATLHLQAATHVSSGDNSTLILNAGGASWGSTPTVKLTGQDDGAAGGIFNVYTNNTKRLSIIHNGNTGIGTTSPTQRLQIGTSGDGTVALANAWNTFSDIRLKRDLAVIPDALDKLLELHGYYYFWKDGSDQTRQVGVVAQEVEKILPELVRTGSDGIKTVDYPKLTAVLIEGTKQLKAEKDSEIAQLKARADAAEAEAALLKRALCEKLPDLAVCSL